MTITAPEEAPPQRPVPATGGVRRWWRSWRVALRVARRDAWRDKWRSLLVVAIILAPVAVLTTIDVYVRTDNLTRSAAWQGMERIGTAANARVVAGFTRPAAQSPDASTYSTLTRDGRLSDWSTDLAVLKVQALLPPEWRTTRIWTDTVTVRSGQSEWGVNVAVGDTRDPLVAGTYAVVEGRLPVTPSEVVLDTELANSLDLPVGSPLVLYSQDQNGNAGQPLGQATIIGIANGPESFTIGAMPGLLPGDAGTAMTTSWLVETPSPLTWSDIRAQNQRGLVLTSRSVLTDPPAFCAIDQACMDDAPLPSGPDAGEAGSINLSMRPDEAAALAAVGMLALLQVALMAGPAFAVSLRRRQRDLALIGANGGTPTDLRRAILSSALVLGLVAAGTAVAVAWLIVRLGGMLAPRFGKSMWPNPVLAPEVVAVALVAVIAAVAAAWVPARIAGRTDVLHALRGRRPSGPLRHWVAGLGAGLVAGGTGLIAIGAVLAEAVSITLGLLTFQVGTILLVPWLVNALARGGRRLPLSLRLATRDAARSRMRTVAAVSAVAAAAIGATATLVGTASNVAGRSHFYAPRAQPGVVLADITYAGEHPERADPERAVAALRAQLAESLPGATIGVARQLGGYAANGNQNTTVVLHLPDCPHPMAEDGMPLTGSSEDCMYSSPNYTLSGVVRADDQWYAAVTGDTRPEMRAALATGEAIVLDPQALQDGTVELATTTLDDNGETASIRTTALPARLAAFNIVGPRVIVGPSTTLPKGWGRDGTVSVAVVPPAGPDGSSAQAAVEAATGALSAGTGGRWTRSGHAYLEAGYQDDLRVVLGLLVAGTLALALFAALSVTALALVDARPDLATMAAVGAPPRSRRTYAAASALVVAGLGCVVGVVAGLVPGWALARLWGVGWQSGGAGVEGHQIPGSDFFTVPWLMLLAIAVGVPLITAAVAWTFTRSRIPLTRRTD